MKGLLRAARALLGAHVRARLGAAWERPGRGCARPKPSAGPQAVVEGRPRRPRTKLGSISSANPEPRRACRRRPATRRVGRASNIPANTLAKHWSTRPPTTQMGIEERRAVSRTHHNISQKTHEVAAGDATLERDAPLFCENVVFGAFVRRRRRGTRRSASNPPCTRLDRALGLERVVEERLWATSMVSAVGLEAQISGAPRHRRDVFLRTARLDGVEAHEGPRNAVFLVG